jgi:glyoxylate reductase
MKDGVRIVNCARGGLIVEADLKEALDSGKVAGAGLDVFERGHEINPRLKELPNAILLPHMGSATVEGRIEMGEKVLINIKTFADGHRPPDLVVPGVF